MKNIINHIAFVIDSSGSMYSHRKNLPIVFDRTIQNMINLSKQTNQETRVSTFLFNYGVKCEHFDMDVLRVPKLSNITTDGQTALVSSVNHVINEFKKIPTTYGDHSFMIYVLTDGEDNLSTKFHISELKNFISEFEDNWTLACMVPNQSAKFQAVKFGFPTNNVSIWDTSDSNGLEEAGSKFDASITQYYTNRSMGIRGSNNFFSIDSTKLNSKNINSKNLYTLNRSKFEILRNSEKTAVQTKKLVESNLLTYINGQLYYNLIKTETVQPQKNIILYNKKSHHYYHGSEARKLLGLPDYEVKISPVNHPDFDIYVQSTAPNRNIIPNQTAIYIL